MYLQPNLVILQHNGIMSDDDIISTLSVRLFVSLEGGITSNNVDIRVLVRNAGHSISPCPARPMRVPETVGRRRLN